MMRSLILMAIFLCETVVSDVFLRIDLNADQLERRYGNNSNGTSLETDQKDFEQQRWEIGDLSKHDESNDIPSGLSERDSQKYNKLLRKLKFTNVINGPSSLVSTKFGGVPTTRKPDETSGKMNEQVQQTTPTTLLFNQPRRQEIFPEAVTDVDEDYDIIIMDDKTLQLQPILAPSGFGFFHGFVNLVRWLISLSANVEIEDYVDE